MRHNGTFRLLEISWGKVGSGIKKSKSKKFLLMMPLDRQRPFRGQQNSPWQRAKGRLSLAVALSTIQVKYDLARFHPNLEGRHLRVVRDPQPLFLFHQPNGRTRRQTSMSSAGFEPRPYGVANHYTVWATKAKSKICYILRTF
ncbi:hypothetical protein TNCV_781271 [Trichonephila clavipes]|nr:hypothetical protein TNCV_781271 [Trichonephila clavipes]